MTLPRGHGCIVKHGSSFLFRRKEAKENQIGGCAILTLPRGTRLHRETRVFFSSLSSAGMPRRGMPLSAANPSRPAVSFVSFLQEKKTYPVSLEEPAVGPQGKRSAANGQTQADPALSSAGMPRRGMPLSAANPSRPAVSFVSFLQEKKTYPVSLEEPAVGPQGKRSAANGQTQADPALSSAGMPRRGMPLSAANPPRPQCLLFLFFKKRKRSPSL